jgi:hypothetical protein
VRGFHGRLPHNSPPPQENESYGAKWTGKWMRRQECVVRVVGISGSVADAPVAGVVLAVEVWTVPKPALWNT